MGGSSKTTETKQTATVQPQTPRAIQEPILNYYSGVDNYLGADPYQFVTQPNDIQKTALNNTGGLFGASPIYGQAAQIATNAATQNPLIPAASQGGQASFYKGSGAGSASASSMMDGFNRYLDPTLGALVDTTLADFDVNSEKQKAAQQARYAGAGAFGGSRSAIGEGLLDSELARARATADATLRNNAWNTAGNWAQFDATGRNNASIANAANATSANIAQMQQANAVAMENARLNQDQSQFKALQANQMALQQKQQELAAANSLAAIGEAGANTYRSDLGAQLDAGNTLYSLENAQTQAPITQLQNIAGLLNPGGVVNSQTGQITTGAGTEYAKTSGGLLNGLLAVASLGVPFIPGYKG